MPTIRTAMATALWMIAHPTSAQEFDLDALAAELGAETALAAGVDVSARLEGPLDAEGSGAIVVTLAAREGARLVADPGIAVLGGDAGPWLSWREPVIERIVEGRDYFERPQAVRVPFEASAGGVAPLRVEYAYCLADEICLFGDAELEVELPRPAAATP